MTTPAKKPPTLLFPYDAPDDLPLGTVLDDRYRIEGVLGSGGMGIVYRARHIALGKRVAIKVLRRGVATDPDNVIRFRREAQAATAIGHPHIIDVSDFGETRDGCTYFVMEYLVGAPLARALFRGGPLDLARVVHIARQLASALGAAHREGILHRDLKPDNIFLITADGDPDFVKVLDFGIAKILRAAKLTLPGEVFGSPGYMSPEQCRGKEVDARSDVYALGVVLFELVTGRRPFVHETHFGLLEAHQHERPPFASSIRRDCPADLDAILSRCLAKLPENRYATCDELLGDLDRLSSGIPVWVPEHVRAILDDEISTIRRMDSLPHEPTIQKAPRVPSHRPPARSRTVGVVALGALGLAITSVGLGAIAHEAFDTPAPMVVPRIVLPSIPRATRTLPPTPIRLESDPEGAEVVIDGRVRGATPYSLARRSRDERVTVVLRKAGYEERTLVVSSATLVPTLRLALTRTARVAPHSEAPRIDAPPAAITNEPARIRRADHVDEITDPWN